ncbi:hypothetical protein BwiPL1_58340 (plasmid) [Bacillus wiedmannii]|nr:hypothetical protein BwiPL1_58340 [Bacillus wiedmannii]
MNFNFRDCEPFIPQAILTPPKPANKPTINSMFKHIRQWVYFWSVFGYTGWIFILQVGVEENPKNKNLEPAIWGCHPGIGNKFLIFLNTIDNYAAL